jgi:hypothetical protein
VKRFAKILLVGALVAGTIGVSSSAAYADFGPPMIIQNLGTGYCLEAGGNSQGDPVITDFCNANDVRQFWTMDLSSTFHMTPSNAFGLCLDAQGAARPGTPLVLWTCNSISNENWSRQDFNVSGLPPLSLFVSRISGTSSQCLFAPSVETQLNLNNCDSNLKTERWTLTRAA